MNIINDIVIGDIKNIKQCLMILLQKSIKHNIFNKNFKIDIIIENNEDNEDNEDNENDKKIIIKIIHVF